MLNTNLDYRGRTIPIHSPILILLLWAILIPICLITVPLHIVIWLFDHKGFMKGSTYAPPWWAVLISIVALILILT
jgi:hypothetical protein